MLLVAGHAMLELAASYSGAGTATVLTRTHPHGQAVHFLLLTWSVCWCVLLLPSETMICCSEKVAVRKEQSIMGTVSEMKGEKLTSHAAAGYSRRPSAAPQAWPARRG